MMDEPLRTPAVMAAGGISRRRLLVTGAGLVLGGGLLAACGDDDKGGGSTTSGSGSGGSGGSGGKKRIGASISGVNEYNIALVTGMYKALEGTDHELVVLQANFNASDELRNIQSLVAQKVDGIVMGPVNVESGARGAAVAGRAGIPVVNYLWEGESDADRNYIGVIHIDNEGRGGPDIANYIMRALPDGGGVLLIPGVQGDGFNEGITKGIKDTLTSDYPVLGEQPGNYVRSDAITAAQNLLSAHPDARAIVTYASEMGNGVASFLRQRNIRIVHVTSDANRELTRWLGTPWMAADRYYSSAQQGEMAVNMMVDYLVDGSEPAEFVTELPMWLITGDDLDPNAGEGKINDELPPFSYPEFFAQAEKI